MPQRLVIFVPEHNGLAGFMAALVRGMGALAIGTVTAFKDNVKKGLPTIMGTVMLLDPETGTPLAVMDAGYLTALRTGAASGVATKHPARDDAHIAVIFGAGVQGATQLEATCTVRSINEVRVFDIDREQAQTFADEMGGRGPIPANIKVGNSPTEALAGADVVATATHLAQSHIRWGRSEPRRTHQRRGQPCPEGPGAGYEERRRVEDGLSLRGGLSGGGWRSFHPQEGMCSKRAGHPWGAGRCHKRQVARSAK